MKLDPYLFFPGNAEEAFAFYKSVFGGETTNPNRYKDMPGAQLTPEQGEKIMHIGLRVGDSTLMGTDNIGVNGPLKVGDNFSVCITPDSLEEGSRIFNALSEGGKVEQPFEKAFWGEYFGACTDKFGIDWMVSYAEPKS